MLCVACEWATSRNLLAFSMALWKVDQDGRSAVVDVDDVCVLVAITRPARSQHGMLAVSRLHALSSWSFRGWEKTGCPFFTSWCIGSEVQQENENSLARSK